MSLPMPMPIWKGSTDKGTEKKEFSRLPIQEQVKTKLIAFVAVNFGNKRRLSSSD